MRMKAGKSRYYASAAGDRAGQAVLFYENAPQCGAGEEKGAWKAAICQYYDIWMPDECQGFGKDCRYYEYNRL